MGNIKSIQHGTAFTRHFDVDTNNNKVTQIDNGGATVYGSFLYDSNGNMITSNTTRNYEWDHSDQLRAYYNQTGTSEPTVYAHYLYDGGGNRIKKLVRTQGGDYTTAVYIDGLFEHHKKVAASGWERTYIHIMDDKSRIAVLRTGDNTDDISEDIFYNLEDHLGSSCTRLTTTGTKIDLEEYYPFGDSSLRTFSYKRYRYVGKEKDSESGLYYYGARYYAAWTGRFISVDPLAGEYPFYTPYQYAGNKPINFVDLDGFEEAQPDNGTTTEEKLESLDVANVKKAKKSIEKYERKFDNLKRKMEKDNSNVTDQEVHREMEEKYNNKKWMWVRKNQVIDSSHANYYHAGDLFSYIHGDIEPVTPQTRNITHSQELTSLVGVNIESSPGSGAGARIYDLPGTGVVQFQLNPIQGDQVFTVFQSSRPQQQVVPQNSLGNPLAGPTRVAQGQTQMINVNVNLSEGNTLYLKWEMAPGFSNGVSGDPNASTPGVTRVLFTPSNDVISEDSNLPSFNSYYQKGVINNPEKLNKAIINKLREQRFIKGLGPNPNFSY